MSKLGKIIISEHQLTHPQIKNSNVTNTADTISGLFPVPPRASSTGTTTLDLEFSKSLLWFAFTTQASLLKNYYLVSPVLNFMRSIMLHVVFCK